jgi:hypothetical protein
MMEMRSNFRASKRHLARVEGILKGVRSGVETVLHSAMSLTNRIESVDIQRTKCCTKCKDTLDISHFRYRTSRQSYVAVCTGCAKAYFAERRKKQELKLAIYEFNRRGKRKEYRVILKARKQVIECQY